MRRIIGAAGVCLFLALGFSKAGATIFGTVRGVVHDPQHQPVAGAQVTLKAQDSAWMQSQQSNDNGEFDFEAVPVGNYIVTVTMQNFREQQQSVQVLSGTSPVLHFALALAAVSQQTVVNGEAAVGQAETVTPSTLVSREEIQQAPGADQTNNFSMITDFVPGAYMVHDMLHVRGGHQYEWLIDGVPIPNTNIASNVGPQIDPKDIDYMEVQRGSYDAQYGDRTFGIFNVVPRNGFERDRECDLVLSFGNFYQSNDQISCGDHTERFAYYASLNGNRSDLGLGTPVAQVIHDAENGYGGFASLIFNHDTNNQLRMVASVRQDYFQIPTAPGIESQPFLYSPETVAVTPAGPGTFSQQDAQRENDRYVTVSWVHKFADQGLLTVSPFYHFNDANYDSSPFDMPNAITSHRTSQYSGAQATATGTVAGNTLEGGFYGYWQRDSDLFDVLFNDFSNPNFQTTDALGGNLEAVWLGDKFQPVSWLTLSGGVRQTHFASASIAQNPTSPRAGVAVRLPKVHWVARVFYGQYYQAPPLITITGPLLGFVNTPADAVNQQQFTPLPGELDTESQAGLTIPYKGWVLDFDTFRTLSHNFLDHGNVNYDFEGNPVATNLFLPLTTQEALVRGAEVTLRSPQLWRRAELHLAYSNQSALFRGAITGGLNNFAIQDGWAPLDHDQRNTLNAGFDAALPWKTTFSGNVYYGSGFLNGAAGGFEGLAPAAPQYLAAHTTVDLSVARSFGERVSVAVNGLNVGNSHLLIDDSFTFGGFHYNDPREVYAEIRYRFRY